MNPLGEDLWCAVNRADKGSGSAAVFVDFVSPIELWHTGLVEMIFFHCSFKVDLFCFRDESVHVFGIQQDEVAALFAVFDFSSSSGQEFIVV